MPYVILFAVILVASLTGAGASYLKGHKNGYNERDVQCTKELTELESARLEAERQANAVREKGRVGADRLAAQLANTKDRLKTVEGRLDREIAKASRERRAFDEQLVRMLNELSPIRESSDGQASAAVTRTAPKTSSSTPDSAGRDGAAGGSSGGRGASVHSVAVAMKECRIGYEACRTQLHGLIDWAKSVTE